jgi:hypothetical protein
VRDRHLRGRHFFSYRRALTGRLGLATLAGFGVFACFTSIASATSTYDMRGEWRYVITCSCTFPNTNTNTLPGVAVIDKQTEPGGAWSGSGTLGGLIPSTVAGIVSGNETSIEVTAHGPGEAVTLVVPTGAIEDSGKKMQGSGTYTGGGATGTFAGEEIRTYQEIEKEQEELRLKAKEEKQKAEKEKEKAEKETLEKEEKAKQAKKAQEAAEAKEREAREKAQLEKEAKEKAETSAKTSTGPSAPIIQKLISAGLSSRTLAVGPTGTVSLSLTNTNGYAISGDLTLTATPGGAKKAGRGSGKGHTETLGEGSFAISAGGSKIVTIKLSKGARAELRHLKLLHVTVTLTTRASGQPSTTDTSALTLKLRVRA